METSHLGIIFNKIKKLFRKILKKRNKETETIIQNTEENNMLQETIYDNRELSWLKFNKRVWCRKCDHERQRTDGVWFIYRESDCRAGGRENPAAVRTFRGICDTAVLELAEIFAES